MMIRLVLLLVLGFSGARAIVWRSDMPAIEEKASEEMKQAGKLLYSPLNILGGSCVAIGGEWVLTSRHGTDKWPAATLRVSFPALGKKVYQVEKIVLWGDGDLALLRVDKPVRGAKTAVFFEGEDEVGKRAWLGGFGLSGPVGKAVARGTFHSGHNRIEEIRKGKLAVKMSKPDDSKAEKDEATLALMDSGSPMFLETDEGWKLAGIGSSASNGKNPGYGDRGSYARVSKAIKWIGKTTK